MTERPPKGPARARTTTRRRRIEAMAKEIVDVEGAAELLGVSTWTIYHLARGGKLPGTRVGREWRFVRASLIQWVANGSQADQLQKLLSKARPVKRRPV